MNCERRIVTGCAVSDNADSAELSAISSQPEKDEFG
jgi:hypothetical protein